MLEFVDEEKKQPNGLNATRATWGNHKQYHRNKKKTSWEYYIPRMILKMSEPVKAIVIENWLLWCKKLQISKDEEIKGKRTAEIYEQTWYLYTFFVI